MRRTNGAARVEIGAFCEAPAACDRGGITVCDFTGLGVEDLYIAEYCYERSGYVEDRTIRNGADAVDVGKRRRDGHERERRTPGHPARTGGDGARPGRHPRHAARLQPVERHHPAAREPGRASIPAPRPTTSKSPTAPRKRTTCWRWRCCATATRWPSRFPTTCSTGAAAEPGRQGEPLPPAHRPGLGAGLGGVRARRESARRAWSTFPIPTIPPGSVLSRRRHAAHRGALRGRWARSCWPTKSTWAPKSTASGRRSFWGMSDRVIVTSGLSKAYGIPGRAHRLDRRPEGRGGRMLEPARLPDHRPQQDFRRRGARGGGAGEPREALRAHARHPAAQPADHARVGRELRRLPDVPRTAGRARCA